MLAPSRGGRCGGENHIYAGDAYLPKGQNNTNNKMYPMEHKTLSPPYNNQKGENFPRSGRKMGLIPQPASSQYRLPQLDTNSNVRQDNAAEIRKRTVPTKRFRPSAALKPIEMATCPPVTISKAQVNVKPQTEAPENRPPTFRKCLSLQKHPMAWCWKDVSKPL